MSDRLEKIVYIEGRTVDEVYREKIIENYIIKESTIEEVKKYLLKDEKIGRRIHCRETENYIFVELYMSYRHIFLSKRKKFLSFKIRKEIEINFLYDSLLLVDDLNKNQGAFLKYKNYIPDVYLHLAISRHRDLNLIEKFLAEFKTRKRRITHKEMENVMLFGDPKEGFALWILACLNLNLIKEARFATKKLAKFYFLSKNKRKEFLEYMNILSYKYIDFYGDFKKGQFDKVFRSGGASSAHLQPDRSQKIYADSTISSTDGEIYFIEGEVSLRKSDGTKLIIRKDKDFYPRSLSFLGSKISEFFQFSKDKGYIERRGKEFIIKIWIERIQEILDKVEQWKTSDVSKSSKIEELFPDISISPTPPFVSVSNLFRPAIAFIIYIKNKITDLW